MNVQLTWGTYLVADNKLDVGYVPMELSSLIFTFLKKARSENKVQVKMTGWRRLENGLVVPRILPRQNDQLSNRHKIWRRDHSFEEFKHSHGHNTTHFLREKPWGRGCTPIWRLHTKLNKGAWNVSAKNSETVCQKDLRLGQIVYILVFYSI